MDETLRQLGGLLLGSIPTIIFFVLLYAIYTVLVHKPLVRVLAERRSKTEGAIEQARKAIALAEVPHGRVRAASTRGAGCSFQDP